jgi:uncharacterized protein YbjT (DUF2867 family)
MSILVTGSTGNIGSQVVSRLAASGADVRALTRDPEKARLPAGVTVVRGDLMDVGSMRAALDGVTTLFLLNAVTADELTQSLIAVNLARHAGIERLVYLSVFHSDRYHNVPHFTGKHTVEQAIEKLGLPATVLRPAYFMSNDVGFKDAVLRHHVYPMPVGQIGLSMVDTGDIADIATGELLRRNRAEGPLPSATIPLVGPEPLTGQAVAAIWSDVTGAPVAYGGDDAVAFEQRMSGFAPGWMAFDLRLMIERFQQEGMVAASQDVDRMAALLGRPPRSYRDFATATVSAWRND